MSRPLAVSGCLIHQPTNNKYYWFCLEELSQRTPSGYDACMCGRYGLYATAEELREMFRFLQSVLPEKATPLELPFESYNITPGEQILVFGPEPVRLHWGLKPSWAKRLLINARAETIAAKPTFRHAMRCLIPASGFYEWKKTGQGKHPCFIHRPDSRPFAFAGLCEAGECAIVTTAANDLMRPIHDRMPVIVDDYDRWLSGGEPKPSTMELEAYRVGPAVNDGRNKSAECIVRV